MNDLVITGARPYGEGEPVDVLVEDGVIVDIGTGLSAADALDADGLVLLPGFVDLHTHLREPGGEESETIATGSAAAALGGFTAVFAMPNTDPVVDTDVVALHVRRRGAEVGLVDVHPVGAVTVGLRGELEPGGLEVVGHRRHLRLEATQDVDRSISAPAEAQDTGHHGRP